MNFVSPLFSLLSSLFLPAIHFIHFIYLHVYKSSIFLLVQRFHHFEHHRDDSDRYASTRQTYICGRSFQPENGFAWLKPINPSACEGFHDVVNAVLKHPNKYVHMRQFHTSIQTDLSERLVSLLTMAVQATMVTLQREPQGTGANDSTLRESQWTGASDSAQREPQ